MRLITEHQGDPINDLISIVAMGDAGTYQVSWNAFDYDTRHPVLFHGPNTAGHGFTEKALLAICADRFRGIQAGPNASHETAAALQHVEEAMRCLNHKTELARSA